MPALASFSFQRGIDMATEQRDQPTQSERGGSVNFANNPEKASEAGRTESGHSGDQRGRSGNFANDQEEAREAGRKGGQHSHGGR
jgi:hypothetical protein